MAIPARMLVEKQLGRVWRRLFLQIAFDSLLIGWALGLTLATLWFVLRPFAFSSLGDAVRWGLPGGCLLLGTIVGLILAWTRRPNQIASSLAMDEAFDLKERVTTFLMLSPDDIATDAGQALLHDVSARLEKIEIAGAFPLHFNWKRIAKPIGAFVLALLACLLDPVLADLNFRSSRTEAEESAKVVDAKEVQKKLDELKEKLQKRGDEALAKSEEVKELEKLLQEPIDGKDQEKVREQLSKIQNLEDKLKERMEAAREKAEKIDALKKQLQALGLDKDAPAKDGLAKNFEDALANGNLNKAREEIEKLARKLKDDKLDPKERKQLAEDFKRLQDKLQRLLDNDDLTKQLKKDFADGKINKEELDRELERLKDLEILKDLGDLKDLIGDARAALGVLDGKNGKEALDKLMKRFEEIELTEKDIQDILKDQKDFAEARELMRRALAQGNGEMEGDGLGDGKLPGGRRPIDKDDPKGKIFDQRNKGELDPKGLRVTGFVRGGTFTKIPAKALDGVFRQAGQDAPAAIERQRIPDDAKDISRQYFDRLANPK